MLTCGGGDAPPHPLAPSPIEREGESTSSGRKITPHVSRNFEPPEDLYGKLSAKAATIPRRLWLHFVRAKIESITLIDIADEFQPVPDGYRRSNLTMKRIVSSAANPRHLSGRLIAQTARWTFFFDVLNPQGLSAMAMSSDLGRGLLGRAA